MLIVNLIYYLYQHIDKLIMYWLLIIYIHKSSCQLVGWQDTPRALRDMVYMIILFWNITITDYCAYIILYLRETHEWLKVWLIIKLKSITQVSTNTWRKSSKTHSLIFKLYWPKISLHLIHWVNVLKYQGRAIPFWPHNYLRGLHVVSNRWNFSDHMVRES